MSRVTHKIITVTCLSITSLFLFANQGVAKRLDQKIGGLFKKLIKKLKPKPDPPPRYPRKLFRGYAHKEKRFRWKNAYAMAVASKLADLDANAYHKAAKQIGFTRSRHFFSKDTQAFVASNKKMVLISFRGTEKANLRDVFQDIKTRNVSKHGGKVHEGFNQALSYVWRGLLKEVRRSSRKRRGRKPIWITGHSLGGALSILTAARLRESRLPVQGVYTFGQPRVGNSDFRKRLKVRIYRIVRAKDPVPYLPKKPDLLKKTNSPYVHVGSLYYFNSSHRYHRRTRSLPSDNTKNVTSMIFKYALKEHSMKKYVSDVYNILARRIKRSWPKPY